MARIDEETLEGVVARLTEKDWLGRSYSEPDRRRLLGFIESIDEDDKVFASSEPFDPSLLKETLSAHRANMAAHIEPEPSPPNKPSGLWYSCGWDWLDWMIRNMPAWAIAAKRCYKMTLRMDKMLTVADGKQLLAFTRAFGGRPSYRGPVPDWAPVSKRFWGFEMCPFLHEFSHSREVGWIRGWDVSSGCVWDERAILTVTEIPPA